MLPWGAPPDPTPGGQTPTTPPRRTWGAPPDATPSPTAPAASPWGAPPDPAGAPPTLTEKLSNALKTYVQILQAPMMANMPDAVRPIYERVSPIAHRVGGAVLGGMAGGLPGAAIGSGIGEIVGQAQELAFDQRKTINPTQVAVQTALGAIPVGKVKSVANIVTKRAAQGAAMGGVSSAATELAEGRTPTVEGTLTGVGLGAVVGGGAGAIEGRAAARAAAKPVVIGEHGPGTTITVNGKVVKPGDVVLPKGASPDDLPTHTTGDMGKGTGGPPTAEDFREWQERFRSASTRAVAGEKTPQRQMSREETRLMQEDWKQYSRSRGYSEQDIRDFQDYLDIAEEGRRRFGIDPAEFDFDAAAVDLPTTPSTGGGTPPTAREIEDIAKKTGQPIPEAVEKTAADSAARNAKLVEHFPEPQREGIASILSEHEDLINRQVREVQPIERTQAISQWFDDEAVKHKFKPGTILNAEQFTHLKNVSTSINDQVDALVKKAAVAQASPTELLQLERLKMQQIIVTANFTGVEAEAGRLLRNVQELGKVVQSRDARLIQQALRELDPKTDILTFAKQWVAAPDDVARMQLLRNQLPKLSKWDVIQSVRYANMLSGLKTTARNILGGAANIAFHKASHLPAVAYDVARSKATGQARTMFLSELAPEVVGTLTGLKRGLDAFRFTLTEGYSPSRLSAFDVPRRELRYGGKNPFNWPGRFLEAQDAFMYETIYSGEVAGRTMAEVRAKGLKQGLRGKALNTFVTEGVADALVSPSTTVAAEARQATLEMLYREEGGDAVKWLLSRKRAGNVGKALEFLVPFVKVPANIMRQSIENVLPGATVQSRAALNAGGRAQSEVVGRAVTGISLASLFGYWAIQGKLSGNGPSNPTERQALLLQGWKPNSIKIGDTWVEYSILGQAIAMPLFAVANAYEQHQETGKPLTEQGVWDIGNTVAASAFGAAGSMMDQSFLSGLSDLSNAMDDPSRFATSFVGRQVQTAVVPFAGLSRNVTQAMDPVMREPKNPGESVRSILPGLSTSVPAKIDPFGMPAIRTGTALERLASPIGRSPESTDPVVVALKDLGISLGVPERSLNKTRTQPAVTLTEQERQRVGQVVRGAAEVFVKNASFQRLVHGNERQREQATTALRQAIERARSREYTNIRAAHRRR